MHARFHRIPMLGEGRDWLYTDSVGIVSLVCAYRHLAVVCSV